MASILQKVVRNQTTTRIISSFNKPILTSPLLNHLSGIESPQQSTITPFSPGRAKSEDLYSSNSLQFYPSFPFGCFLNPISSTGCVGFGNEEADSGDSVKIWADSVKKKRKRKMNKHKLKKLRKRLRRKT